MSLTQLPMAATCVPHCLLLLGAIHTAAGGTSLTVGQNPRVATVSRGGEVTIYCFWPLYKDQKPAKVDWWREGENRSLEDGRDGRIQIYFLNRASCALQLFSARLQDAGVYRCRVRHRSGAQGPGTRLLVFVPPTPLEMVVSRSGSGAAASLTLVCKTAAFYPEDVNITWCKNGSEIVSGTNTNRNLAGLYEASSLLIETEAVQSGAVYTCHVSHLSLPTAANISYTVPGTETGNSTVDSDLRYALISGGAAVLLIVLTVIFLICRKDHTRSS
ncbi:signal-regulatory protein beta-1-like isoform X2 [Callorhinchus milii]|uniref:signal-regulatory protein beta-1-like isoform X2 n=1 Tax=Callorhinchus milii TaxID=7868 RepID=UPI001C3F9344|nr:signal-regulatory protein beta-1-like isoform X2 [Callorhinchus milii]